MNWSLSLEISPYMHDFFHRGEFWVSQLFEINMTHDTWVSSPWVTFWNHVPLLGYCLPQPHLELPPRVSHVFTLQQGLKIENSVCSYKAIVTCLKTQTSSWAFAWSLCIFKKFLHPIVQLAKKRHFITCREKLEGVTWQSFRLWWAE